MAEFARPDVLVSTNWVAENLHRTQDIRLVESNEDLLLYETGHIPNAVKLDWVGDLQDQIVRDYIGRERFARLCERRGISNSTTVVFYGDKNNWWATYAFWVFALYGHPETHLKIMDGGRRKWIEEERPLTKDRPLFPRSTYSVGELNPGIRAFRDDVMQALRDKVALVDVRSPQEYSGELTHMPDYPQEGAMRAGHIPGAVNVPWARAAQPDGSFKSREDLEHIYAMEKELNPAEPVITYCRIGERSSHTWFVLKYLLGFENVRNYDGSWTEWGNLVGVPIVKGDAPGELI